MKLSEAIATLGGIGRARVAPGTVASFVAVVLALPLAAIGGRFLLLAAGLVANAFGAWACEHYAAEKGVKDPPECVVDELAGQWIACAFVPLAARSVMPLSLVGLVLAFVLFRALDILKPWPISALEKLPGGFGIMADDLAAGLAAGVLIAVLAHAGLV